MSDEIKPESAKTNASDEREAPLVSIKLLKNIIERAAANPLRLPITEARQQFPKALEDMLASGRFSEDVLDLVEQCLASVPESERERERAGLYAFFGLAMRKKRRAPRRAQAEAIAKADAAGGDSAVTLPDASQESDHSSSQEMLATVLGAKQINQPQPEKSVVKIADQAPSPDPVGNGHADDADAPPNAVQSVLPPKFSFLAQKKPQD